MTKGRDLLPDLPGFAWEEGTIYYLMCSETGRMKIGYTRGDVQKRLKSLQTGSPTKLRVAAIHPGTPESERRLHEQFAEDRLHGEWFDISPELILHCYEIFSMIIAAAEEAGKVAPEWVTKAHTSIWGLLQDIKDEIEAIEAEEAEGRTIQ